MKYTLPLAAAMLLAPTGLLAQTTDAPADAPSAQTSDTPADTQADTPPDQATDAAASDTQSDTAPAQAVDTPAPATGIDAHFTLDTPIKTLIADPGAKAVLDKDLPGLSTDENLDKFSDKSLRQLQPMTGGQLTDDLLRKTGEDLAAIGGDAAAAGTSDAAPDDTKAADNTPAASDSSSDTTDDAAPPTEDTDKTAGNAKAPEGR